MSTSDSVVGSVAGRLRGRVDELSEKVVTRIQAEVAELRPFASAQLWQMVLDGTRTALETELHFLERDREQPVRCPEGAAEGARQAAAARIPVTALLHTQRIGHAVMWDAYVAESELVEDDPVARKRLLDMGARFFFDYADALARFTAEEHAREAARPANGGERRRLRAVLDLLDGTRQESPDSGYEIRQEHIAVVAWGLGANGAVAELGRALGRQRLTVEAGDGVAWAWFGGDLPLADGDALAGFDPRDAAVAVGSPGRGVDGFRTSHADAQQAYRIALRRPRPVTRFADVALEALALDDEGAARRLVAHELGPLGKGDRALRLRETLRAYFRCEQTAAAAAAALGVHEQTVAQRLRAIEELIGAPVNRRRAELELALRVEELLAP